MMRFGLALLLATAPLCGLTETIEGRVIGVSDGDTITVLSERRQFKIRLSDIDAPEKKQDFGQKSKQSLSHLCYNAQAKINAYKSDRYGRKVGRVQCDGIDANAEQVRRGMAWVYDQYAIDRSLYELQTAAQNEHRGLWAEANPTPPWKWRKSKNKK